MEIVIINIQLIMISKFMIHLFENKHYHKMLHTIWRPWSQCLWWDSFARAVILSVVFPAHLCQWRILLISIIFILAYLIVNSHLIECHIDSESGSVMMRSQSGLLIWFISHYKRQIKLRLQNIHIKNTWTATLTSSSIHSCSQAVICIESTHLPHLSYFFKS